MDIISNLSIKKIAMRLNCWAKEYANYGEWGDGLRVWDGNAVKLGCDDRCTIINVVKFTE